MQRLRTKGVHSLILSNCKSFPASSPANPSSFLRRSPSVGTVSSSGSGASKGFGSFPIRPMSDLSSSGLALKTKVEQLKLLNAVDDIHGGVTVEVKDPMDSEVFNHLLEASLVQWNQQGKKGVWIKVPIEQVNLVEAVVKHGFRYHHAEPDYLMLVRWLPKTTDTLPANASHRVGIGAFVMNSKREVLVVQEKSGKFKGSGVWKFPTGVVNEGEDICMAAKREVKEETGIDTDFVEVLGFRQSHKSFFRKSDLFFVCMLKPCSFHIEKQAIEIEAAQWMPVEEYSAQSFVQKNEMFRLIANICLTKADKGYAGFAALESTTASGKRSYLYFNKGDMQPQ